MIDGRFELLERLGGGGMGQVWRARDLLLQREVALKEVTAPNAFGSDSAQAGVMRERVLREAQALARLHHPNVVTIFHIVDSPALPHPWLVMELVTGGSLHDRLGRGPLTVPEATRVGRGVLSALRAAHAAGIQHRDVKPGNVLLRADGTPVLTDFGIAALQESPGLTATGMLIGSPEYMAPERIHGHEGNPASDLWSLGLLLYVGLEGYNPLRRETTIATIAAVVDAPIPPPSRSGALGPVLSGLLVRDPGHRAGPEWTDRMLSDVERAVSAGSEYNALPSTFQFAQPAPPPAHTAHTGRRGHPAHSTQDRVRNPYGEPAATTGVTPRKRRRSAAPYMAGLMTFGIAGGTLWIVHDATSRSTLGSQSSTVGSTGGDSSGSPTSGPASSSSSSSSGKNDAGTVDTTDNLLSPKGAKAMVAALQKADGGTNIVEMDVYSTYADIKVVKKDDPTLYDNWVYRNGVAKFDSTGEVLDKGDNTINPNTVNWEALTTLFTVANRDLKVPNPNLRYFVVDSDLISQIPEWLVYVSDDYGGGHLAADLHGKITDKYARGDSTPQFRRPARTSARPRHQVEQQGLDLVPQLPVGAGPPGEPPQQRLLEHAVHHRVRQPGRHRGLDPGQRRVPAHDPPDHALQAVVDRQDVLPERLLEHPLVPQVVPEPVQRRVLAQRLGHRRGERGPQLPGRPRGHDGVVVPLHALFLVLPHAVGDEVDLVAEVVVQDAVAELRVLRDLAQTRTRVSEFGQGPQGRAGQLRPALGELVHRAARRAVPGSVRGLRHRCGSSLGDGSGPESFGSWCCPPGYCGPSAGITPHVRAFARHSAARSPLPSSGSLTTVQSCLDECQGGATLRA